MSHSAPTETRSESTVRLSRTGRVATLVVDRPPLNILDLATLAQLGRAVEGLAAAGADEETPAVVVVRGGGTKAFSAGVAVEDHTLDKVAGMLRLFHTALDALRDLPMITVAAVRGHCLGGGLELALACDLVLADESSRFGQPEVKLGCFPPYSAALLPARIGTGRTLELLASGRTLSAAEAERLGIVTRTVPDGELDAGLEELVAGFTAHSTAVLRVLKAAVTAGERRPFPEALTEAERLYNEDLCRLDDMNEGLAAFLEKRRPTWKHR